MKRRTFLRRSSALLASGILPVSARNILLPLTASRSTKLAGRSGSLLNDRILVLVNLSGGNDGLNTVVSIEDSTYYALRPTLAIPASQTIPIDETTALHPSLSPLVQLYEDGLAAIIQGVGYPDMNLSHFRSTDIWFSGSSGDQYIDTGWLARFVEGMFPDFPSELPDSPYGLQQAFAHQIPLTGDRGTVGVVVNDPDTFYQLVNVNYSGSWDNELPDTRGGEELAFVRGVDQESFEYAETIQGAADIGQNTVPYPDTELGTQLEIVAKLISGGLETPIYLTAEFNFDTHASQAGPHSQLLSGVASSIASFMDDLTNQGLAENVVVLTTSEFGRRVEENGSLGTDHGTAAPHFVIGAPVHGGIYGSNPDLTNLDQNGNMLIQYDYRSIYRTILTDFFGADPSMVQSLLFGDFPGISFLESMPSQEVDPALPAQTTLHSVHPNPVSASTDRNVTIRFDVAQRTHVRVELFDLQGRKLGELISTESSPGRFSVFLDPKDVPIGTCVVQLRTDRIRTIRRLVILP